MNKAIIITSGAVALFFLISCRKCKTCTTDTTIAEPGSATIETSTSSDYCGKDYDDSPTEGIHVSEEQGTTTTVEINCMEK